MKNGLELVEGIVYVDRDTCERPHGVGSCVVLGFGDLPRYTGVIPFQAVVRPQTGRVRQSPVTLEYLSVENAPQQ